MLKNWLINRFSGLLNIFNLSDSCINPTADCDVHDMYRLPLKSYLSNYRITHDDLWTPSLKGRKYNTLFSHYVAKK